MVTNLVQHPIPLELALLLEIEFRFNCLILGSIVFVAGVYFFPNIPLLFISA